MSCIVLLASTRDAHGNCRLSRSDAAAVHGALATCRPVTAFHPALDSTAGKYAAAAGIVDVRTGLPPFPDDFDGDRFECAWIGAGMIELGGDLLAAQIAEGWQAALLFDVFECHQAAPGWTVVRDAGRGARDVLVGSGPVVLVVSEHAARPPYISRHRRERSRIALQRPLAGGRLEVPPQAVGAKQQMEPPQDTWQPVKPRVRVATSSVPQQAAAADRLDSAFGIEAAAREATSSLITADPMECARQLLRYLVHHGFVERPTPAVVMEHTRPLPVITESASLAHRPDSLLLERDEPAVAAPFMERMERRRFPRHESDTAQRLSRLPRRRPVQPPHNEPPRITRRPRPVGNAPRHCRGPFP